MNAEQNGSAGISRVMVSVFHPRDNYHQPQPRYSHHQIDIDSLPFPGPRSCSLLTLGACYKREALAGQRTKKA